MASKSQYGAGLAAKRAAGFKNATLARKFGAKGSGAKTGKGNAWRAYVSGK